MGREVVLYPVVTEKTVRMIETENKIAFVVDKKASKHDVKRAVEDLYRVKVQNVNTFIGPDGRKRAYVRLAPESSATELSIKLKIL